MYGKLCLPFTRVCADGALLLEILPRCEKVLVTLALQILEVDNERLGNVFGPMNQTLVLGVVTLLVTVGAGAL